MKTKNIFILAIYLFFTLPQQTHGQGWEKTFGDSIIDKGHSVQQTMDGGYIIVGVTGLLYWPSTGDVYLIKTDANGDAQWKKTFGGSKSDEGYCVKQTTDGGYIIAGYTDKLGNYMSDVYLIKTDANGNSLWSKTIDGSSGEKGLSVEQTSDGGYVIVGFIMVNFSGNQDVYLIKTDENGDTLWTKTFGGKLSDAGYSVHQTMDGGFIIAGTYGANNAGDSADVYLIKTDGNGDSLWTKNFGGTSVDYGYSVQQTTDGGYIITGSTQALDSGSTQDVYLIRTDAYGDTLWTKVLGGSGTDEGHSVQQTRDGGYIITGGFGIPDTSWGTEDVYLIKTDGNGNTLWTKTFGGTYWDQGSFVQQTSDGGYIITGFLGNSNWGGDDVYLIKTDSLGNSLTNTISGNIFMDPNSNCNRDNAESALKGWLLKSVSQITRYETADSNGFYSFLVDSGSSTVSQVNQYPYWTQICPPGNSYTINFASNSNDTSSNNNFGNQISIYCPLMWVDISTGLVRNCRRNTYTVNYCNNGTVDANNAFIEVEFPDKIIPLSSTPVIWSSVNGNVYHFDLGIVNAGSCGTFYITDSVACDALRNSSICVKAKIYPDTICTPVNPTWDKSSIFVKGDCMGDSVIRFVIYNSGASMNGTSEYRIYINNALSQTQNFQLQGGDSLVIEFIANRNTIRLEADQRPNHPGKSNPRVTLEGCGPGTTSPVLGMVNLVSQDDEDDFVDIDCKVIRGSFDPNEKLVSPEGITTARYISSTDELEYQINFQNTGNDTAFLIVVRDTLPASLEVASVVSGTSSHPYAFRIYDTGILEWTFRNILLPDSNINEPASHGFVKFKVNQKSGNLPGTQILNRAGIYFDYNAPVVTEPAWVKVQDTTIITYVKAEIKMKRNALKVSVIPNPFSKQSYLEIFDGENSSYSIHIYDVLGQLVFFKTKLSKQTWLTPNLPIGVYIYKVKSNENVERIVIGKLIVD